MNIHNPPRIFVFLCNWVNFIPKILINYWYLRLATLFELLWTDLVELKFTQMDVFEDKLIVEVLFLIYYIVFNCY